MMKSVLESICKNIYNRLMEKKHIDEELIDNFFNEIAGETLESKNNKNEDSFRILKRCVYETWQYGDIDKMSCDQAFLLGGIWGGIKIKDAQYTYALRQDSMDIMVRKYTKNVWLFKTIYDNPGIIHKELAAKGKQSPAQLSQFVSRVCEEGLITYNRIGREKFYYLQKRGEELLNEINKQTKAHDEDKIIPYYKKMIESNVGENEADAMGKKIAQKIAQFPDAKDEVNLEMRNSDKQSRSNKCM